MPNTYTTFLSLEDGKTYQGWSFNHALMSVGEVVFSTGMTGYQEVITDPSYFGQIILFTYPEIGNTGINDQDIESFKPRIKGIIAKNICLNYSNWRSEVSLVQYLVDQQIPHIFGIDTRSLTKYIRDKGVMGGCISNYILSYSKLIKKIKHFNSMQNLNLANKVTTTSTYKWHCKSFAKFGYTFMQNIQKKPNSLNVIVIDFGVKLNILNRLSYYGCDVTIVPAITSFDVIMSYKPDGVLLSNGPGDPALIYDSLRTIRSLIDINMPLFGICLGHQLLSLALGATTFKLGFGHRGLNHPSGLYNQVKITSQNHGFAVSSNTLPQSIISVTFLNLNDNTVAGLVHNFKPCFSVQYHPEASPGPHDSDYLFMHFIKIMLTFKHV